MAKRVQRVRSPAFDFPVHLRAMAAASHDGRVYRAFDHALAARQGQLLAVPLFILDGDHRTLVDSCPVPWQEVLAVLNAPVSGDPAAVAIDGPLAFGYAGWSATAINLDVDPSRPPNCWLLEHGLSGIRYACTHDLAPDLAALLARGAPG